MLTLLKFLESRQVVYGPENGYNFPSPCLLRVNEVFGVK